MGGKRNITKLLARAGLLLVVAGALLLVASQAFGWTDTNGVQLSALSAIIVGIAMHVGALKAGSKY